MSGYQGPERRAAPCDHGCCPREDDVIKMFRDLYFGIDKDNPSITSRLLLLEQAIERFTRNSSKIIWLLVTTLVVGIANLIFHGAK